MRLYYAVKLSQSGDISYYADIMGLCSYPEMASGIIIGCLPVSPKFFQNLGQTQFITNMGSSIRSLFGLSKSDSLWSFSKRTGGTKPINPWDHSSEAKSWSKRYSPSLEGHELIPVSRNTSSNSNVVDGAPVTFTQSPKADAHIMRTVHIAAVEEHRDASALDARVKARGTW